MEERFTPADAELVQKMARKFARTHPTIEVEDLAQDVAAHVISVSHRHDEARGSRLHFISKVAKHKMLHLLEAAQAKKRDRRGDVPLDAVGAMLDGSVSPEQYDTVIDVREVLASLPEDLRQIAMLCAEHSERDIADLLGRSRQQVRLGLRTIRDSLRKVDPDFSKS